MRPQELQRVRVHHDIRRVAGIRPAVLQYTIVVSDRGRAVLQQVVPPVLGVASEHGDGRAVPGVVRRHGLDGVVGAVHVPDARVETIVVTSTPTQSNFHKNLPF